MASPSADSLALSDAADAESKDGSIRARDTHWKFVQSFDNDESEDDERVTAVQFDSTGQFLAVGDKSGMIYVFEGKLRKKKKARLFQYNIFTEFQSHDMEFDVLKSMEIDEKINRIEWCLPRNNALFLLSTNDKTVKYWKVHQSTYYAPSTDLNRSRNVTRAEDLKLPSREPEEEITQADCKRVFGNAHQYHINSLSLNSDGELFLSADDLRINLWNLENSDESFNIVDVKPRNLEDLVEVITAAHFHPQHCSTLMYSTSRGSTLLCDMRESALCDRHAKQFRVPAHPSSFFSEIIASVSDANFTANGNYIFARDYLSIKLWDIRMERAPVQTVAVHDYLANHLVDLYENECIFDKFQCAASGDGSQFITGSYNSNFIIYDHRREETLVLELGHDEPKKRKRRVKKLGGGGDDSSREELQELARKGAHSGPSTVPSSPVVDPRDPLSPTLQASAMGHQRTALLAMVSDAPSDGEMASSPAQTVLHALQEAEAEAKQTLDAVVQLPHVQDGLDMSLIDFEHKALHVAFHPCQDVVAVASQNRLYIYQATAGKHKHHKHKHRSEDLESP